MTTPDTNHDNPAAETNRFSGLYPNNTYPLVDGDPDIEQQKRLQARQESGLTRRVSSDDPRGAHPSFTRKGPDSPPDPIAINPTVPSYDEGTDVLTIPLQANVSYYNINDEEAVLLPVGDTTLTVTTTVEARAAEGYVIPTATTKQWTYTV